MRENQETCTANKHWKSVKKVERFFLWWRYLSRWKLQMKSHQNYVWKPVKVVCKGKNKCDDGVSSPKWSYEFHEIANTRYTVNSSGSYVILFLCKLGKERNNTLCVLVSSSHRSHYVHRISWVWCCRCVQTANVCSVQNTSTQYFRLHFRISIHVVGDTFAYPFSVTSFLRKDF